MKIQICLMGGETMPNVIGVLQQKPDVIKAVATDRTVGAVDAMQAALKSTGYEPQIDTVEIGSGFDALAVKQAVAGLQDPTPGFKYEVNWTGGTKVMAAAAREVAVEKGWDMLYVNTQAGEILLDADTQRSVPIDLEALGVTAMTQIIAAGHQIEAGLTDPQQLNTFAKPSPELLDAAEKIYDCRARRSLYKLCKKKSVPKSSLAEDLAQALCAAELIVSSGEKWDLLGGASLRPMGGQSREEAAAQFIQSGHLEVFMYQRLKTVFSPDDLDWHVTINRKGSGQKSEFDVLMYHQGRLLVLDAKINIKVDSISKEIMHQCASTQRISRLFSCWMLYINQYEEDLVMESRDRSIIESQKKRAVEFGGRLLFRNDLEDSKHFYSLVAKHMGIEG